MGQLYTVRMSAKRFVSVFAPDGTKVSEELQLIPQVYGDLPLVTARAYERLFPDNGVTITLQESDARPDRSKVEHKQRSYEHTEYKRTQKAASPAPEKSDDTSSAAQTGDMAAAINAGMK